ncbi:DUF6932 family protein [Pseudarthrobacter sp. NPDC057230]|uniref:DUF6932 family protein n=1 Tax=Pseudarthrobacter sp. NPDC057230 TaxID=3346057 RepID=UPI00363C2472
MVQPSQGLAVHPETGELPWMAVPIQATLVSIRTAFVTGAPFSKERERLWDAFMLWDRLVQELLPNARVYLDGSFLCHRQDVAPDDIDVFVIADPSDYRRLSHEEKKQIFNATLLYGLRKYKPFDVVDANYCDSTNQHLVAYWAELWSRVRLKDGRFHDSARKGYVEVLR